MKLSQHQRSAIRDVYEAFWGSLFYADMELYSRVLDDRYRLIGTTDKEVFFTKKEAIRFLQATADQLAGNVERRRSKIRTEAVDHLVLITDQFDSYVLIEKDWIFYGKTRVSTWMQQKRNEWKIVQQHFSFPDTKAEAGQTVGLEKIAKENLQLREAVQRRTLELENKNRELEIEAALEKVRTVAMGMKMPEDMLVICKAISKQLSLLGVKEIRNIQTAIFYYGKGFYSNYQYYAKHDKTFITDTDYTDHRVPRAFAAKMRKGKGQLSVTHIRGRQQVKAWVAYQKGTNVFIDKYLNTSDYLGYYWYSLGPVAMGISTYQQLTKEEMELFKRFQNVFDLAYRRYLDIEKAEAQAREAKIEAALERVRARSMAMHSSAELEQVIRVLTDQLSELGFHFHTANFITNEKMPDWEIWISSPGLENIPPKIHVPYIDHPLFNERNKDLLAGKEMITAVFGKKEKNRFFRHMLNKTAASGTPEERKQWIYDQKGLAITTVLMKTISLSVLNYDAIPYTKEENEVIGRMGKVFEQSYTRFLDLQKAEAQARESQIQLALERIRARTMAMQKSDELPEAANLLFHQVKALGMPAWSAGYCIWVDDKKAITLYMSSEGVLQPSATIPTTEDELFIQMRKGYEQGRELHVVEMGGEKLVKHYQYMRTMPVVGEILDSIIAAGHPLPVFQIMHQAYFSKGFLLFITYEPVPDAHDIFKRFANVFEQTYTRFLDLQKAEAQAKEAQIEAALEKVRSRTMAMQSSDELQETAAVLFNEFKKLGTGDIYQVTIGIYKEEEKLIDFRVTSWSGTGEQENRSFHLSMDEPTLLKPAIDGWRANKRSLVVDLTGEALEKWLSYRNKMSGIKVSSADTGGRRVISIAYYSKGHLSLSSPLPVPPETLRTLERFAAVFDATYTRFLDLQKAEAQAREAQIEAALERVRSKAMAMHKSGDLQAAVAVVFDELHKLDLGVLRVGISVLNKENRTGDVWLTSVDTGNAVQVYGNESFDFHPLMRGSMEAWIRQEDFYYILEGEDLTDYYKSVEAAQFNLPASQILSSGTANRRQSCYVAVYHAGGLFAFREGEFPVEAKSVMKRFAGVFDLTYKRFLDLQKAEAQAREAQIELGLERVRARAMAMQGSEELNELVGILFEELTRLDMVLARCIIWIFDPATLSARMWMANSEDQRRTAQSYFVKRLDHPYYDSIVKSWKERRPEWVYDLGGDSKRTVDEMLLTETELAELPEAVKQGIRNTKQIYVAGSFNNFGFIEASGPVEPSREQLDILNRFGKVFDLSYTRFNDLKQAEAQAREAKIEASLERVRSRTMAMQRSDELAETASELFRQMIGLGIEPSRLYITIIQESTAEADFWITDEDGSKLAAAYTANLNDNPTFRKMYEGWMQQRQHQVIDMHGEELQDYFRYLTSINVPFKGGLEQKRRVQHLAYFSRGFIGLASPEEQPAETLTILERFAYVFNLTFTRFNDLKIAEAHALQAEQDLAEIKAARKKAEETLTELQATQKQLIQSEKMASLGELTAGIAHEIQNPLNFVNNFSEVSNELLQEMLEEVAKGNYEEVKAIADDVKQNLEKINHHGKRADGIVKGMLQHSRSSTGQKELTDINLLCDEYLRLAYHGLRAKDKSFNAKFETHLDESVGKVSVMPQDMGRVILNLINNAFYAVSERKKAGAAGYEPTVTVSTKKENDWVEIRVKDNGTGVPQKVLDKIFQPFFTTKPTGQGTGLGLSLSYDIVKAHGGELRVETKEGEGTEFIFFVPFNNTTIA